MKRGQVGSVNCWGGVGKGNRGGEGEGEGSGDGVLKKGKIPDTNLCTKFVFQ